MTDVDSAPVDFALLRTIYSRLHNTERFQEAELKPDYAPNFVVLYYDLGYFPQGVEEAFLQVRWYTNDDFNIHYEERYSDGDVWKCRWDRHPSEHNSREHFHQPPDASTPGRDASFSEDWRDVLSSVLEETDRHVEGFWRNTG
ncbi:MAG: hypothetical protein U5J64_02255 [Halobacteriales archaeon]|nr:hypothetical protein [Halobacteriales archaeon]